MTTPSRRGWDQRRFVSLGVLFCGLVLPFTGLGNHLARHPSGPHANAVWVGAHVAMGSLFVVLATWHVVLNRRALLKYVRGKQVTPALLSREALASMALVAGVLVLALTPAMAGR